MFLRKRVAEIEAALDAFARVANDSGGERWSLRDGVLRVFFDPEGRSLEERLLSLAAREQIRVNAKLTDHEARIATHHKELGEQIEKLERLSQVRQDFANELSVRLADVENGNQRHTDRISAIENGDAPGVQSLIANQADRITQLEEALDRAGEYLVLMAGLLHKKLAMSAPVAAQPARPVLIELKENKKKHDNH